MYTRKEMPKYSSVTDKKCPECKVRLKALYVRGGRRLHQPFLPIGGVCPQCKYKDIDADILVAAIET